jgi:hypothetical protein
MGGSNPAWLLGDTRDKLHLQSRGVSVAIIDGVGAISIAGLFRRRAAVTSESFVDLPDPLFASA